MIYPTKENDISMSEEIAQCSLWVWRITQDLRHLHETLRHINAI